MHQVVFTLPGGIPIYGFGLMLFLALLASMNLAAWRARRSGLNPEILYDLAFWLILSGLLGARIFYVLQHGESLRSFWDIFKIWRGGIVLYGSMIGGIIGILLYHRLRPFPFWPVLDAIAPAAALGMAFGRIGCFLNGCCYGDLCDSSRVPWGVRFPARTLPWLDQVEHGLIGPEAPLSLPVHPTQLYAAVDGFLLCVLLLAFYPLRKRDGEVAALLAIFYPISRFLIEQLRDDEGIFLAGMTISQTISVALLAVGLGLWAWLHRKPPGRFEDRASANQVEASAASAPAS